MPNNDSVTQQSGEVVQRCIDALNSGNAEGFLGCFAPDLEFDMPGTTPVSGKAKGLPAFTEVVTNVAQYLDVLITIKVFNFIVAGEWVVTEAHGHGVTKKGKDYNNRYCHLWQVRNGKIVKFIEYNDTDLVNRVLCS